MKPTSFQCPLCDAPVGIGPGFEHLCPQSENRPQGVNMYPSTQKERVAQLLDGHGIEATFAPGSISDSILSALTQVRAEALAECRDRGDVSVHGTGECLHCDDGRITLYAKSRMCIECQNRKRD